MTEDGVGDLKDALDLLNFGAIEVELFDDVVPFPLIVDRVREAPLPPRGHLLNLSPIRLDQLADLFDLLLDLLVIKLRLDDVHQLVGRHTLPPFLWICSDYGLAAAAEQESVRSLTNSRPRNPNNKSGRPKATACGGKPNAFALDSGCYLIPSMCDYETSAVSLAVEPEARSGGTIWIDDPSNQDSQPAQRNALRHH